MKHCYGHEQLDPCEYCGTPLVGADYDDDYSEKILGIGIFVLSVGQKLCLKHIIVVVC